MGKDKSKTASWLKTHIYDVAAYAGLAITVILFLIFSGDKLMYNATTVLQTVAPYAIISLGSVFVYSMGFMDVSVGQQVGVYAILYILISNKMGGTTKGVVVAFIVVLAIALACGAFNGAVAVWLGLPYRNFPVPDVLLHRSTAASDGRNRKYQYFHPGEDQAYGQERVHDHADHSNCGCSTSGWLFLQIYKIWKIYQSNRCERGGSRAVWCKYHEMESICLYGVWSYCCNWFFYHADPYRQRRKRNWNWFRNGRYDLSDPWRNASFRRNEIQSQQCTDWNFYLCTSQQ